MRSKIYNRLEAMSEKLMSDEFQIKLFARTFFWMGIVSLGCGMLNPWLILIGCMCLLMVIACTSELKK